MLDRTRPLSIVFTGGTLVAAFVAVMLATSGVSVGLLGIVGLWYGGIVIAASGLTLMRWVTRDGVGVEAVVSMSVLVGSVVTSIFLTAACLLTGITAGTLFVVWSVIVAIAWWWPARWRTSPGERADAREAIAIAALALLVVAWCHQPASVFPSLHATGALPLWSDYFIHATEVAQFGEPRAAGHASFLLAGLPVVFYHYALFMLPAATLTLVKAPALAIAASVLLPYGLLLMLLGAYAFVRTLTSGPPAFAGTAAVVRTETGAHAAAFVAAAALVIIPDAAAIALRNGFFSFHWLLFTSPGSGYALGVAFAVLACVARQDRGYLWLAGGLTLALFEFRAHVFLLFVPALAMALLWEHPIVQRRARMVGTAMIVTIAITAAAIAFIPPLRHAWLNFSVFDRFLWIAHAQHPTGYDDVYDALKPRYTQPIVWIIGIALLLPAALGALILALPAARFFAIRATGPRALDSLPYWALAVWLGLVIFAPKAAHGDFTEFQHRPFVVLYAIWMVWTVLYLQRAISALPRGTTRTALAAVTIIGLCAAAIVTLRDNPARPRFDGGMRYFGEMVEPGLEHAAAFVRTQAAPGDIFALLPAEPWATADDAATRFAAMANVPAYIARAGIQRINGEQRRIAVDQRLTELSRIESETDANAAMMRVRAAGVRFLIVLGEHEHAPRFDPDRARAAFRNQTVAVYDTRSSR